LSISPFCSKIDGPDSCHHDGALGDDSTNNHRTGRHCDWFCQTTARYRRSSVQRDINVNETGSTGPSRHLLQYRNCPVFQRLLWPFRPSARLHVPPFIVIPPSSSLHPSKWSAPSSLVLLSCYLALPLCSFSLLALFIPC
jgi:hypothetical protein